ncbi:hypothetical protein FACS1894205_0420 [Alphaproteobacteria bacterium]|nr:hypothetical protein FACS1894205_0420 [Alphaproteobacteria bacterium]
MTLAQDIHSELRRLSIAGVGLAAGDRKIAALLPQARAAGAKAPVFARLAGLLEKITQSGETAASLILEAASLDAAIMGVQAGFECAGEISSLKGGQDDSSFLERGQVAYSTLKPILAALSTKGSGRLDIIQDALETGALLDFRLIPALTGALGDSYSEIPPVAAKALKQMGELCVPALLALFNPKGERAALECWRFEVLADILGEKGRDLYLGAYREGGKDVRMKVLPYLSLFDEFEPDVAALLKSKKKDERDAALCSLAKFGTDSARETLRQRLRSADYAVALGACVAAGRDDLCDDAAAYGRDVLNSVALKLKDAALPNDIGAKDGDLSRLCQILFAFYLWRDKTPQAVELIRDAFRLAIVSPSVELEEKVSFFSETVRHNLSWSSEKSFLGYASLAMASVATRETLDLMEKHLADPGMESSVYVQAMAFLAKALVGPERFYEIFYPLYGDVRPSFLKKLLGTEKQAHQNKKQAMTLFFRLCLGPRRNFVLRCDNDIAEQRYFLPKGAEPEPFVLDPGWAEIFIREKNVVMLQAIAAPGAKLANAYLERQLAEAGAAPRKFHEDIVYPAAALVAAGEKAFLGPLIARLEKEFVPCLLDPEKRSSDFSFANPRIVLDLLRCFPAEATAMLKRVKTTDSRARIEIDAVIAQLNEQG